MSELKHHPGLKRGPFRRSNEEIRRIITELKTWLRDHPNAERREVLSWVMSTYNLTKPNAGHYVGAVRDEAGVEPEGPTGGPVMKRPRRLGRKLQALENHETQR